MEEGFLIEQHEAQAKAFYEAKNFKSAIIALSYIIKLDPSNDVAWVNRGVAKYDLGLYEDAYRDFAEAERLNPQRASVKLHCSSSQPVGVSVTPSAPSLTRIYSFESRVQVQPVSSISIDHAYYQSPYIGQNSDNEGNYSIQIQRKNLIFIRKLHEDGCAEMYSGEWIRTTLYKIPVTIKQLKINALSSNIAREFKKEVELHAKLNSSAVVKIYGVTEENTNYPYCIVMELMVLGSLQEVLQKTEPAQLGWDVRLQIAKDIATGLAYLHEQNPMIVHGDIKSSTILLNNQYRAKITDFGLFSLKTEMSSRYYMQNISALDKPKSSVLWMAPELFKMNAKRTRESDMFSYAVVLWELASRRPPYLSAKGDESVVKKWVREGTREAFDDEITPGTPDEYREITARCWRQAPVERLTASLALKSLENIQVYAKNPTVRVMFSAQPSESNSNNVSTSSLLSFQKK